MKKIILVFLIMTNKIIVAQNSFQFSFSIGQGSSVWQYSKMQIAETNQTGDTLNLYDVDIHANGPTITADLEVSYRFNKITSGIGISAQHFFINELITDAIYFEESNLLIPTIFTPYNNPQPTHLKLYPFIEFNILQANNLELFTALSGGTFFTHSITDNLNERFSWFVNITVGIVYYLNEKLSFSASPVYDYSRLNLQFFDDPQRKEPFINIYSFYSVFGLKYNFSE